MILASASPRRRELLSRAGFDLSIEPANIDETRLPGESPLALVERLATQKAKAAHASHGRLQSGQVLLAADTIVWTGDDVLGKPADEADARRMLSELSGAAHHVSTGVCLVMETNDGATVMRSFVETTQVTFKELTPEQVDAYVATGEPMDKAGAYGIQGGAGTFVSHLEGDYDNVVGLPVGRIMRELSSYGLLPNVRTDAGEQPKATS